MELDNWHSRTADLMELDDRHGHGADLMQGYIFIRSGGRAGVTALAATKTGGFMLQNVSCSSYLFIHIDATRWYLI